MLFASIAVAATLGATPSRSPSAAPASAPPASAPAVRADPCGGAQELLKKYLAASPCVFVFGQASLQALYVGSNAPSSGTVVSGGQSSPATAYRHTFGYPSPLLNVGVTRNSQLAIAFPSFTQASSALLGTLAAGTTDMQFSYKNLFYVDRARGVLGALLLSYEPPTGSPGIAAPGPAYVFNPLVNFVLNKPRTIALSLAFPLTNSTGASNRVWTFVAQAVPLWRSPGGTLLALVVQHNFANNTTPLTINAAQLLSRQFQIQGTYGAAHTPFDFVVLPGGVARATGTTYARSFTLGASYMMGTSDALP